MVASEICDLTNNFIGINFNVLWVTRYKNKYSRRSKVYYMVCVTWNNRSPATCFFFTQLRMPFCFESSTSFYGATTLYTMKTWAFGGLWWLGEGNYHSKDIKIF